MELSCARGHEQLLGHYVPRNNTSLARYRVHQRIDWCRWTWRLHAYNFWLRFVAHGCGIDINSPRIAAFGNEKLHANLLFVCPFLLLHPNYARWNPALTILEHTFAPIGIFPRMAPSRAP